LTVNNELALAPQAQMDVMTLGQTLAKSGYFSDVKDAAQAVVKVLAGRELGIGDIAAMTGIYIVKGRVTMSANLMAAQIKRSGKYNYRITRMENDGVTIVFYEGKEEIGTSSFTADDAKAAGLWNSSDPWKKTPRNMLFARAMSNGAKWFTPDIFSGPVYTPDELSDTIDVTPVAPATFTPKNVDVATGEIVEEPTPRDVLIAKLRQAYKAAKTAGLTAAELPTKDQIADSDDTQLQSILDTVYEMIEAVQSEE
jgi:hypothetical protein